MEALLLLLASSGVFQQPPALPLGVDSVPAAAAAAVPAGPVERAHLAPLRPDFYGTDDALQRPRAVQLSEAYHVRLTIHRVASFATVPFFVAEYLVGRKLYSSVSPSQSLRQTHRTIAAGVAGLFAVNTVTGAWNLWDSRKSSEGALRRYLHSGLMFLADAGFVATGATAPDDDRIYTATQADRNRHRTLALASMGTALASYALMLIWKD